MLPGDLKVAFVGPNLGQDVSIDDNPLGFVDNIKVNDSKGGFWLNDYLTFNCLVNTGEELSSICVEFNCDFCEESLYASSLQILNHHANCFDKAQAAKEVDEDNTKKTDPNAQAFDCKKCGKTLYLTSTEILRHMKTH